MARGKVGISKLAVPVALIVVLVVAGAYVFLAKGATTTSTTGPVTSTVRDAVDQLVHDANARSVDGLASFYTTGSVVLWSGNLVGLQGKYTGAPNIRLLYATTVGKTSHMSVNMSDYAEKASSPTDINSTYRLKLLANSSVAGIINATINVSEEWNLGSGGWQISRENWAYTYYDSSYIDAGIPSATTFPQWGVMEKGGNPNLVSEKSLEWHAGPYLAAGVYAFLSGIIFVLAVKLRARPKP
jgi:hypothetical protein